MIVANSDVNCGRFVFRVVALPQNFEHDSRVSLLLASDVHVITVEVEFDDVICILFESHTKFELVAERYFVPVLVFDERAQRHCIV